MGKRTQLCLQLLTWSCCLVTAGDGDACGPGGCGWRKITLVAVYWAQGSTGGELQMNIQTDTVSCVGCC